MKSYVLVIAFWLLACASFLSLETSAQNYSGEYRRGSSGTITIKDTGQGADRRLIISIAVGQAKPSCSGAVEGKAKFTGKNTAELVLADCEDKTDSSNATDEEAEICTIRLVFSGNRLVVTEGDKCHRCHGFSCIFDGTYLKKAQAPSRKRN